VYAGDELSQHLLHTGLSHQVVSQLRSPGGLTNALDEEDTKVLHALHRISVLKGYSNPLTEANLRAALSSMTSDELSAKPRGKQVTEIDVIAGNEYKENLHRLGETTGIDLDYNVHFQWYPIESQRVLLYATEMGAAEAYADALARRHFTKGSASSEIATVLDAAAEIGLDRDAVEHLLLQTDDYKMEVLQSYRDTVVRHHIHSIPQFTFKWSQAPWRPISNW